jgi:hypothetical protein
MIEREAIDKKTGRFTQEVVCGITRKSTDQANPQQLLDDHRRHSAVESCHSVIDWNYDEDRSQIRTGFGPENIFRSRRFTIGLIKSKQRHETNPEMMKKLPLHTRAIFDSLKMTRISNPLSTGLSLA